MCDYDVERAVGLYFETDGADLTHPSTTTEPVTAPTRAPPPPPPAQLPPVTHDLIDLDEEDDFPAPTLVHSIDSDEALARRLMEEDLERNDPVRPDGGVRSPIPQRSEILVDSGTDNFHPSPFQLGMRGGIPYAAPRCPTSWYVG
jgi:hypothetical protein